MFKVEENLILTKNAVLQDSFVVEDCGKYYEELSGFYVLQSYAIVNGTQMPILSVFSKNKSLLQFLQENQKSCKVNIEGNVMRIEKA